MFMFRKKDVLVSTSIVLHQEAKNFQNAVMELNTNFSPSQMDISIIEGVAAKYSVDIDTVAAAFESYLKANALVAIKKLKATGNYSIIHLEELAQTYGFELDSLDTEYSSAE